MGLFSKKQPAPALEITYDDVVEYLRDMAQTDYTKILKVVNLYRDADKGVKKVLGIKENSVTDPATADALADDFISDDDTDLGDFLADEPPKKLNIKKSQKPKGKNEN